MKPNFFDQMPWLLIFSAVYFGAATIRDGDYSRAASNQRNMVCS